ncbi:uncharacterized protein LOC135218505 isoform X2 [Macrobrachium nipponense]|uniref:uncharacterized protein LOC135218505 isoform X2 n=1 Tax=Macrobrachium nipponense TaxID=159736 RepID=UPI0030C8311E
MRPRKPQVGYSLNSKGYFGSSRVLCSTAGLFLFLLINKSCCAQKDLNSSYIYQEDPNYSQTEDSYHGELCCPDDQYFGEGRCISFNNSEKFQPPALPSNVLWTYQGFQCPPGYDPTPIEYKNNSLTLDEGSVSLRWRNLLRKTTKQFCLSLLPTDAYIGVICRPNNEKLCAGATCIQKCCDIGDAVSLDTVECLPDADRNFTLTFQSVSGLSVLPPTNLQLLHRIPDCQPLVLLDPENNVHEHFFLTVDGYLYQPAKENTFHENRFCLDYFTTGGVTGIIGQFALLSAFFWLNVMCFDIHQYVRATLKLIPRSTIQGRRGLRFKCYSAYAWGIPFLITLATTILHYFPDYPDHIILRPGFGVKSCWFYGDIERLTFFYVWVGVLFIGNIFLLAHTAYMLHKTGVTLSCGRKKSIFEDGENHVSNRRNVERFWQSFNLFALMALCWVTEILSWKIPPEPLWIPTDIINTLQGFFIFLFFLRLKTKRDIVKEAILSFSEKARKLSRSEGNSNTFWHCNRSLTVVTDFERHHTEFAKDSSDQQL